MLLEPLICIGLGLEEEYSIKKQISKIAYGLGTIKPSIHIAGIKPSFW